MPQPYAMPRKGKRITEQEHSYILWLYDHPPLIYLALFLGFFLPFLLFLGMPYLFGLSAGWRIGFAVFGAVVGIVVASVMLYAATFIDLTREDVDNRIALGLRKQ